jgi:hypothetical protein
MNPLKHGPRFRSEAAPECLRLGFFLDQQQPLEPKAKIINALHCSSLWPAHCLLLFRK